MYKMYSPESQVPIQATTWEHRSGLLRAQIAAAQADIVCLQECAEASFEADFAWMHDLGYTGCELFRKGRFRPATFWRSDRVTLPSAPVHRDRCLVAAFKLLGSGATGGTIPDVYVVNCHLTAGPEANRRLRQIADVIDVVRKDVNKYQVVADAEAKAAAKAAAKAQKRAAKEAIQAADASHRGNGVGEALPHVPTAAATKVATCVVVCGDMNAEAELPSGVAALLEAGSCGADLVEGGQRATDKAKSQALASFADPYRLAFAGVPPPSMVCELLIPRLLAPGEDEGGASHPSFLAALRQAFDALAAHATSTSGGDDGGADGGGGGLRGNVLVGAPLTVRALEGADDLQRLVLPLRQRVLWPDASLASCLVPGDAGLGGCESGVAAVQHLGVFEAFDDALVGALSLYATPPAAIEAGWTVQLRKFVVEPWAQRKGFGTKLLEQAAAFAPALAARAAAATATAAANSTAAGAPSSQPQQQISVVLWLDAREEQEGFYAARGFARDAAAPEPFAKRGRRYVRLTRLVPWRKTVAAGGSDGAGTVDEIAPPPQSRPLLLAGNKPAARGLNVGRADVTVLGKGAVELWLTTINRSVGRGSEFRSAVAAMGVVAPASGGSRSGRSVGSDDGDSGDASNGPGDGPSSGAAAGLALLPPGGCLTWRDFVGIYEAEVRAGKYWGVAWDLAALGAPLPRSATPAVTVPAATVHPAATSAASTGQATEAAAAAVEGACYGAAWGASGRFAARYDRIWVAPVGTSRAVAVAVRHTLAGGGPGTAETPLPLLPNAEHPSDHLPVGVSVALSPP